MKAARPRKLDRGHFAFMRAVVQGLDVDASWKRYLQLEGDHTDRRLVKKTVEWIRDEFAAAAKRLNRTQTARLVLIDTEEIPEQANSVPTLEEFAAANGLEDFSTSEQLEAFTAEYGDSSTSRSSRRQALIRRQLVALRWLEELVAQEPNASDPVSAWIAPALASRIEKAGIQTLFALVERINGTGARWWGNMPGIGKKKGARVLEWLRAHESSTGLKIAPHVDLKPSQRKAHDMANLVPIGTALVPFEKFRTPAELDGSNGRFRTPSGASGLSASNDYEAIQAWLNKNEANPETHRAYRKEAERLLLWSVLERKTALSSLTAEDAQAYASFLQAPPPGWCGPRHHRRWSPLWRPFEGPLGPIARQQAITILRSLFSFLRSQNYITVSPFTAVPMPKTGRQPLGSNRSLSKPQWDQITQALEVGWSTAAERRAHRAVRWLYATGLRRSEIVKAKCGDLRKVEFARDDGTWADGWLLSVVGKGDKTREVPVPGMLVQDLAEYLQEHGRSPSPTEAENAHLPILVSLEGEDPQGWSSPGLYKGLKKFFSRCAEELGGAEGDRLRAASTHWMRHTHATHAANGFDGRPAVELQIVSNNLGHPSLETTSVYLTTERDQRLRAMEKFWAGR